MLAGYNRMICKGCNKSYDGKGYWRALTTVHDPNYILCYNCSKGYNDHSEPIQNIAERYKQMKEEQKNG
jgi:hypothetical protein